MVVQSESPVVSMDPKRTAKIRTAASLIGNSECVLVVSGTGMAEVTWGGKPRDSWHHEMPYDMTPKWFAVEPREAWGHYGFVIDECKSTKPHRGYNLINDWTFSKERFVISNTTEGHWGVSGVEEDEILELFGSLWYAQCTNIGLCRNEIYKMHRVKFDYGYRHGMIEVFDAIIPRCGFCGAPLRPNVRFSIDDQKYISRRYIYQEKKLFNFVKRSEDKRVVVIEVGTSNDTEFMNQFSKSASKRLKAQIVRIDREPAGLEAGYDGVVLRGDIFTTLRDIDLFRLG